MSKNKQMKNICTGCFRGLAIIVAPSTETTVCNFRFVAFTKHIIHPISTCEIRTVQWRRLVWMPEKIQNQIKRCAKARADEGEEWAKAKCNVYVYVRLAVPNQPLCVIFLYPTKPNCLQTTRASFTSHSSSHILPHLPSWRISILPANKGGRYCCWHVGCYTQ